MTDPEYTAVYTANGWRAVLTIEGGLGRFQLTAVGRTAALTEEAELEVLLQPRTEGGLPKGTAKRVFTSRIPLRCTPGSTAYSGRCWLPAYLKPNLLRACYFRVRACLAPGDRETQMASWQRELSDDT